MMAPYLLRLLCLCLAAFFVIHSVVGLLVALSGPAAVRIARRMRPRSAGRFLLALRLLPAALALFVVAGLCVPSYLWLEPEINAEEVGAACLAAAVLAAALWTISTARGRACRCPFRPPRPRLRASRPPFQPARLALAGVCAGCPRARARTRRSLPFARHPFESVDARPVGRTTRRRSPPRGGTPHFARQSEAPAVPARPRSAARPSRLRRHRARLGAFHRMGRR